MKNNFRTDLALEDYELASDTAIYNEEKNFFGCKVNFLELTDEQAKPYNKNGGLYYTLETNAIRQHDFEEEEKVVKAIAKVFTEILESLNIKQEEEIFIVGLGNSEVTPDALGPKVVSRLLVTKHLHVTNNLEKDKRVVSALAPGVMGQTGIETADIIKAVVTEEKPKLIIVIDALASKSIKRVNQSVQITTAGINPGSGIGNKRKELSKKTLGVDVIAIGVPTVVDIVSISNDMLDRLASMTKENVQTDIDSLRSKLFNEIESDDSIDFYVTPKQIDENINDLADIISRALNLSLHNI